MSDNEMSEDEIPEDETAAPSAPSATPNAPDLLGTTADPALTEDLALALLKRADLPPEVLEQLAKNAHALKSRKVRIALSSHPHTPRHVSVPLARPLYTFALMQVALSPPAPRPRRRKSCRRQCPHLAPPNRQHRRTSNVGPPRLGQSSRGALAGCRNQGWQDQRRQD